MGADRSRRSHDQGPERRDPDHPPFRWADWALSLSRTRSPGGPPAPVSATKATRLKVLSNGNQVLKALEPRLALLRLKLTHRLPSTVAFCNKHFATGNSEVTSTEIGFINGLVAATPFHAARRSATGILPIKNVIEFD